MSSDDITAIATSSHPLHAEEIEITIRHGAGIVARRLFASGEYVVGSEESADLRLDVPGVAARHARLSIERTAVFIEDLGGDHGTTVNGQPVTGRTAVGPSQKIQLGEATLEAQRLCAPEVRLAPSPPHLASVRRLLPDGLVRDKKYEIGDTVAHGGMGRILDAHDALIRRNVAMKVMLKEKQSGDAARFIQEAQITGQLEHPGIVPIYELGLDEHGEPFYTMKFVRGITLRRVLQSLSAGDRGTIAKFPLAVLLTAFQKVCDAIAFAHSRQVIHRDLKPENIMLGDFGEVLVMDWGLAKVIGVSDDLPPFTEAAGDQPLPAIRPGVHGGETSMTLHGTILGTPQFMSPEQARGESGHLDARSDIYALGAILYQILTLRPVLKSGTVAEMLSEARRGEITPPHALAGAQSLPHLPNGRVPESLSAVCMQALAADREDRYARVAELQREILAYQNGFATNAERAGLLKLISLAVRRHKTEAAVLSASGLLLLGFGAFAFHHVQSERDIAQSERNVAKAARERAEATLDRLRATAPTFLKQAETLADEGQFEAALSKIAFAISLQPTNPEYLLFRANLLESSERLAEALHAYRQVLALRPDDAAAQKNLALCEDLLARNQGAGSLTRECQVELFDALIAQGRLVEAAPLALALGRGRDAVEAAMRARLKEYQNQIGWRDNRIRLLPNGMLAVNLNGLQLGDLKKLLGFPIRELDVGNTGSPDLEVIGQLPLTRLTLNYNRIGDLSPIRHLRLIHLDLRSAMISDLSPIAAMPLETLLLDATQVYDLSPLRGMPLKRCSLRNANNVRDLTPLAGMPLESLDLQNPNIRDISPLRGLPLRQLNIFHAPLVEDFSPIHDLPAIEELGLPFHAVEVPLIGNFPRLRTVRVIGWTSEYLPVARFRAEIPQAAAGYLQLSGVIHAQLGKRPPTAAIQMNRGGLLVDLEGLPIRSLIGLEGLPIHALDLSRTQVSDLEPLRNMPLRVLRLDDTLAEDVAPVGSLIHLEELVLPANAKNVGLLRKLPKLRFLSTTWNDQTQLPAHTAEAFWAEYLARKPAPQ